MICHSPVPSFAFIDWEPWMALANFMKQQLWKFILLPEPAVFPCWYADICSTGCSENLLQCWNCGYRSPKIEHFETFLRCSPWNHNWARTRWISGSRQRGHFHRTSVTFFSMMKTPMLDQQHNEGVYWVLNLTR